jgi:hypothetical protein
LWVGGAFRTRHEYIIRVIGKEAKPLPDFTGSDAYFIKLTIDGQVINTNMLEMLKNRRKAD